MVTIQHIDINNEPIPFKFGSVWYANVVNRLKVKSLEDMIERMTSMDTGFISEMLKIANESACNDLNKQATSNDIKYYHNIIDNVGLAEVIKRISTAIVDLTGVSSMDEAELKDVVTKSTKKK